MIAAAQVNLNDAVEDVSWCIFADAPDSNTSMDSLGGNGDDLP